MHMKLRFTKRTILISASALVLLGVGVALYVLMPSGNSTLKEAYRAYGTIAEQQDAAVFFPSVADNEVRQDLGRVLAESLVGEVTNEERLVLAREGLLLLEEAESQIDAMAFLTDEVAARAGDIQGSQSVFDTQHTRSSTERFIALAEERAEVIADIRGLSYRANYHTQEVFDRIVADGGALTGEHVQSLNEQIPLVEEQFDKRSNLYDKLQSIRFEMEGIENTL